MELEERIAEETARLPPEIKSLLEAELAAGNRVIGVETGRGPDRGKVALLLDHPFRRPPSPPPEGVLYREVTDRDPQVFRLCTPDERFSLVTMKFKPMVLQPIHGPPNPTEAHIAFLEKRAREEEAAAAARAAAAPPPPLPPPLAEKRPPPRGGAAERFLASMEIDYEKWHDGIGYDLEALAQLSGAERDAIETVLIERRPRDWRDIEALAGIDSPRARREVEAALKSSDPKVRQEAMRHAPEKVDPRDREAKVVKSLERDDLYGGLSDTIDEVEEFHPPAVVDALFRGALRRDGEAAVNFAALLFYLHGKAKEPFDWDHRPFFLRFDTIDRTEREVAFRELCREVGVDPQKYLRGH